MPRHRARARDAPPATLAPPEAAPRSRRPGHPALAGCANPLPPSPPPAPCAHTHACRGCRAHAASPGRPTAAASWPRCANGPAPAPVAVTRGTGTPPVVPAPVARQRPPSTRTRCSPAPVAAERKGWLDRLKAGLRKTGSSIATVFTGTQIDDALYEELEEALLMADTGVKATQHLLEDLKRRVKKPRPPTPLP